MIIINNKQQELERLAQEQLAEKQMEEMDKMLANRYGLKPPVHTNDEIRGATFADLFSDIPAYNEEKE